MRFSSDSSHASGRHARYVLSAGLALFGSLLAVTVSARALPRDLSVIRPGRDPWTAPAYLGDRLEIRLTPLAAARMRGASNEPTKQARLERLGLAAIDAASIDLGGVWFEPEFVGETPPPAGSSATDFTAFYIAHLPPSTTLERAIERFQSLREVAVADPIGVMPVSVTPDDSLFSQSTWYSQPSDHDVDAPEAWNTSIGDTTILVAVLDTGVIPYHPDIGGRIAGYPGQIYTNTAELNGAPGVDDDHNGFIDDVHGWDFVDLSSNAGVPPLEDWRDEDNDPNDYAGHGTAVAGVVGALSFNGIGVTGTAWNVRIMPLRIGWSANVSPLGLVDMSFVAKAIRYATRMNAHVLNCSFATLNLSGLYEAARAAALAGQVIVCAAGNGGQDHELASREDVIAVAATNEFDQVAAFSNTGSFVDISAPGNNIVSTFIAIPRSGNDSLSVRKPAYSPGLSGTSLSAPIVSGGVALLQARQRALGGYPLNPIDVMLRIRETADDISAQNPGVTGYGAGRLNLARLLTDPPGSSALRAGANSVGPGVALPNSSGRNDVLFAMSNSTLLWLDGRRDTIRVIPLLAAPVGTLAAADMGPGHGAGIFISLTGGSVAGFDGHGAGLPNWPVNQARPSTLFAGPALGDLDGDGVLEVVCGATNGKVYAWRLDGTLVPHFPVSTDPEGLSGGIALGDLDGVPGVEIVACTNAGNVFVIRGDGSILSPWPVAADVPLGPPVIAGLGHRATPAIAVTANTRLMAWTANGTQMISAPLTSPESGSATQPIAVGDLDGDGSDDFVVATGAPSTIAVFDSAGVALAHWPFALDLEATGPPVLGFLESGGPVRPPDVLVRKGIDLLALDHDAVPLPSFPKPGGAGAQPSMIDIDSTHATQVLAGTGLDSVLYFYDAGPGSAGTTPGPWFTPRGNFARTGSRLYSPRLSRPDFAPPNAVNDLAADSTNNTTVALRWTAPGDDGGIGQAFSYDLRFSNLPITEANFASATPLGGESAPGPAGTVEHYVAGGLLSGVTYYFALKTIDEQGNPSALSNVLPVTIGSGGPGRVVDLGLATDPLPDRIVLQWTTPGDDGPSGRPVDYLVRASTTLIDEFSFYLAPFAGVAPATVNAGETEHYALFGDYELGTRYYVAVKARDDQGNLSALSNVISTVPLPQITGPRISCARTPTGRPIDLNWVGSLAGGPQFIRIYDTHGRRLITLPLGTALLGTEQWNGRDDRGNLVPAGLYFARLTSGSVHIQTRIVLLP